MSKRLEMILECVGYADCVADIGTDHAYLPIGLIRMRRAKRVIGMDVRKGPLMRARENVLREGLEERIELRLSDGASMLRVGEADVICITGMGGRLICRIMEDKPEVFKSAKRLLLSPQSELFFFRESLLQMGYKIGQEWMVEDSGKYYFIIQAHEGKEEKEYSPCELHFGRHLLEKKDKLLYEFLQREKKINDGVLKELLGLPTENAKKRIDELNLYFQRITEAEGYFRGK